MTEDRATGLVGIGVLTLLAVFVLVYAISLVRPYPTDSCETGKPV